jgi:hypothetical protein
MRNGGQAGTFLHAAYGLRLMAYGVGLGA